MRLFVTFLALLCLSNSVGFAQRYRNRHTTQKEKITVDSLISTYRFTEAVEQLEDEIAKLKKRRKSTEELEAKLDRVHSLEVMLSATEKVHFVDSFVVDKATFLNTFHLGADCGNLALAKDLIPANLVNSNELGVIAYCNELRDKIYFSQHKGQGTSGLFVTARIGDTWSKAKPLQGIAGPGLVQDFPYVLSDGVTLYYGEKNPEGLGGYDIYVTRYNVDTDSYLKPENIGMPFNSMANDYMYAIDELNNLGWFVTDRRQPEGKVCVYVFQPNQSRQVYNPMVMGEEAMRRMALISSLDECRLNQVSLAKARERLAKVIAEPESRNFGEEVRYVINDRIVYTSLLDFKNKDAQNYAMVWAKEAKELSDAENKLASMRAEFVKENATSEECAEILRLEEVVKSLQTKVALLAKKMRKAELN